MEGRYISIDSTKTQVNQNYSKEKNNVYDLENF